PNRGLLPPSSLWFLLTSLSHKVHWSPPKALSLARTAQPRVFCLVSTHSSLLSARFSSLVPRICELKSANCQLDARSPAAFNSAIMYDFTKRITYDNVILVKYLTAITARGQMTLPADFRYPWKVRPGQKVMVELGPNG